MNENVRDDAAKGSARRRLVRGVFSAPAALTLFSGSVAAASVTCIAKQLTNPIITNGDVTLVRVPLYKLANGQTAKFVRQADIGSLTPPGGSYLAAGQVQLVSKTGGFGSYDVGGIYPTPAGLVITGPPTEYVGVRVGPTGKIEGVLNVGASTGTTALHTSCWTSFGGLAPFQNQ